MAPNLHCYHSSAPFISLHSKFLVLRSDALNRTSKLSSNSPKILTIRCSANSNNQLTLRTCRNCKAQFDPSLNHPRACRFHTSHFGGNALIKLFVISPSSSPFYNLNVFGALIAARILVFPLFVIPVLLVVNKVLFEFMELDVEGLYFCLYFNYSQIFYSACGQTEYVLC